jgi:regulator of nonsense transcripts 3
MPASTPLLDALKAEKSAQRDKEAIQRNHPHYKDAVQASKREEFKKKAVATSSAAAESKKSGESTAPLGKRAAKRAAAAAAQKAPAQAGPAAQPKSGNAPSEAKPPSSSPSKGKSARASKHHRKPPPSTAPSQVAPVSAATAPSSPPPTEAIAQVLSPAPTARALTPASSNNPGMTRPVLGIVSRHFGAALSGADALERAGSGTTPAGPGPGVLPSHDFPARAEEHLSAHLSSGPIDRPYIRCRRGIRPHRTAALASEAEAGGGEEEEAETEVRHHPHRVRSWIHEEYCVLLGGN